MISTYYEGQLLDWKFRKLIDGQVAFHLVSFTGDIDILVGVIYTMKKEFSVVSRMDERTKHLYPVGGFKTRWKAAEFLLKDSRFGYYYHNWKEVVERNKQEIQKQVDYLLKARGLT